MQTLRLILVVMLALWAVNTWGQSKDSLESLLANTGSQTEQVNLLVQFAQDYTTTNPTVAIEFANRALTIAIEADYTIGYARALTLLGSLYALQLQADDALVYYAQARNKYLQIEHRHGVADVAFRIGNIYYDLGEYVKALEYAREAKDIYQQQVAAPGMLSKVLILICDTYHGIGANDQAIPECLEALRLYEEAENLSGKAEVLNAMGSIYLDLSYFDKAKSFFLEALQIARDNNNPTAIATSLSTIGDMYLKESKAEDAQVYLNDALTIELQIGNLRRLSWLYLKLGQTMLLQSNWAQATTHLEKAYSYAADVGNLGLQADALVELGKAYAGTGQTDTAIEYLKQSLNLARRSNTRPVLLNCYRNLAKIYDQIGDIENAFVYFNFYMRENEAINTREAGRRIAEAEALYELDKKQKQIELQQKQIEITNLQEASSRTLSYSLMTGLTFIGIIAVVLYSRYRLKTKANEQLQRQEEATALVNVQLTDSIRYARRIQLSLLPDTKDLRDSFPESFVFYKAKDIVSGDFYWYSKVNGKSLIATVDCTGHGVPGAFMTVLANTLLNQIVLEREITEPREIITLLDQKVQQNLRQDGVDNQTFDGMDIALCSIDQTRKELKFTGAKLPLYCTKDNQLVEIKGDRYPVGSSQFREKYFTSHSINYEPGMLIYLSSDGFQDQFGGSKDRKFMKARFRELLQSVSTQPVQAQQAELQQAFDTWRGSNELTDDVLVIGIKL